MQSMTDWIRHKLFGLPKQLPPGTYTAQITRVVKSGDHMTIEADYKEQHADRLQRPK